MDTTPTGEVLGALLLCGLMGVLGQGVRATIGLKNAKMLGSSTPDAQSTFSAAYFFLSLMIGFIAGIVGGLVVGLRKFLSIDLSDSQLLLGIAASGYVGADFIENSLSLIIPSAKPAPPPQAPPAGAGTPPASGSTAIQSRGLDSIAPTSSSGAPASLMSSVAPPAAPAIDQTLFRSALAITAPKVDAGKWVAPLLAAFTQFDVNTTKRAAAAVGQFLVEAGAGFQEVTENLNYTHAERLVAVFPSKFPTVADAEPFVGKPEAIGNRVYAGRLGNGNEASGDGYRFRGRGLIQLTGRSEYTEFGATVGMTAEDAAAYCETPEGAAKSGCWYLSSRGCLTLADGWQISRITKAVNGAAMLGNAQRIAYSESMLKHLGG